LARALQIPIYQFFYNGNEEPPAEKIVEKENGWGELGETLEHLAGFVGYLRKWKGEILSC
jgi:hypothetical protein